MSKSPIIGSINEITDQLVQSDLSSHIILIYPSIEVFRKLYSNYVKRQLKGGNEIIIIIPYYETRAKVKEILSDSFVDLQEGDDYNNNNNIKNSRIDTYQKEGSLIIKDSLEAYFSSSDHNDKKTFMNFLQELLKKAESSGKDGISVVADLGSFYHHRGNTQDLVDYELSLPPRYVDMKDERILCLS